MTGIAERAATSAATESPTAGLLARVVGEYNEMPGLHLTLEQARRLWHMDEPTCRGVLAELVQQSFLRLTPQGGYVRCA